MMSLIPKLCSECDYSRSLQFELRLSDRDSKEAAFVREVAKIRELVVVGRERHGYFERVLRENISEPDIAAVIKHIQSANTKFFGIEYHIRDSSCLPELQRISHIIRFLNIICDRLDDGHEWKVQHEFEGPWDLYIMSGDNIFRQEKNPVHPAVIEDDHSINPPNAYMFTNRDGHTRERRENPRAAGDPEQQAQLGNMLTRVQHSMR